MITLTWRWPWAGIAALLAAVAVAVIVLLVVDRSRPKAQSPRVFSLDTDLATELAGSRFRQWRILNRVAVTLLIAALAVSAILLARPSKVNEADERDSSRDIILCLDVSGSTLPYDREVIDTYLDLVGHFEGERIGLAIFNSTARTVFPLTDDYALATSQLRSASNILQGVQSQDDIDKMSKSDYQRIADWLEGTQNKKDATSLIGDGVVSCAAMLPGFADDMQTAGKQRERSASIVLATDNVVSGKPTYSLEEAVALASKADITVDGLYSGPQESAGEKTTTQMKAVIQSHGGLFLPRSNADTIDTLVREIDKRRESISQQHHQAALVDAPGWWTALLAVLVAGWLILTRRLKR